jgi:hypothetical protein
MNYENKYVYVSTGYQDKNSTSYRSRDDPSSLAFVVAGYAALLLLLHSLRRFETQQLADGASTDDHSLRFRTYVPRNHAWSTDQLFLYSMSYMHG